MAAGERDSLLGCLDEARRQIEELLPKIDPAKEICPGWTIREMFAHISGWDDACIDALEAHVSGRPLSISAIHSLKKYNESTVNSRKALTYDQILNEWREKRELLRDMIRKLSEEKFSEPIAVPWGKEITIRKLVEIFSQHEKEHAQEIVEWLKQPEKLLGKAGR